MDGDLSLFRVVLFFGNSIIFLGCNSEDIDDYLMSINLYS